MERGGITITGGASMPAVTGCLDEPAESESAMGKSLRHFLVSFGVLAASGVGLILLMPGVIQGDIVVPTWVFVVLGGIAAATAFYAWQVKPTRDS